MSINTRAQEIIDSMSTFNKSAYHRSEVLPELFALQDEIVSLTFNEEQAEKRTLKIWDVERHLEQMNEEFGGVADEELQRFKVGCKDLCNMIKAEISGNKGEAKAFHNLERLRCFNRVLRNVELTDKEERTELDAVVITRKGIFIVEVKNTARDIFIDESGNYFRTGEYLKWDSNIAGKMDVKSRLLRSVLVHNGYADVPITGVVVFTNNRIQVRNCYASVNTCFLSQLSYIIQDNQGMDVLDEAQIQNLEQIIETARCKETYPLKIDVPRFKCDFAVLMATLENVSAKSQVEITMAEAAESPTEEVVADEQESVEWTFADVLKSAFKSRYFKAVMPAAAAITITLATTVFTTRQTI